MVVLSVIGGLLLLLVVACVWETRSGRPEWGRRAVAGPVTPAQAAKKAKGEIAAATAATVVAATFIAGGDGG